MISLLFFPNRGNPIYKSYFIEEDIYYSVVPRIFISVPGDAPNSCSRSLPFLEFKKLPKNA